MCLEGRCAAQRVRRTLGLRRRAAALGPRRRRRTAFRCVAQRASTGGPMTETVRALAVNAVPGFVATLVLLLCAVCGAWWLAVRRRRRAAAGDGLSSPQIAVYLGLSGAVVVSPR